MLRKLKVPIKIVSLLNAIGIGKNPPDLSKRTELSYSKLKKFISLNHPVDPDTG
jgi:hypothetical protein